MRTMMTALILVAAMTGTSAAEHIGDVRLRVRSLTAPEGLQSVNLSGRLAPSAASRRVTATMTVGDTVVTLAGTIKPNGKIQAKAKRVALASALTSFTQIDVQAPNGEFELSRLTPDECLRPPGGRQLDCGARRASRGRLVDGVYDLVIESPGVPLNTDGAAVLFTSADGTRSVTFSERPRRLTFLTLADDYDLTGTRLAEDYALDAVGSAANVSTPAASMLDAAVDVATSFPFYSFTSVAFRRDGAGTPAALGGTWHVTMQGQGMGTIDGTMVMTFTVGPGGVTQTEATTVEQTSGPDITLAPGACRVAPSGGLACTFGVVDPTDIVYFELTGKLDAAAGTGRGDFAANGWGIPPFAIGSWTATR